MVTFFKALIIGVLFGIPTSLAFTPIALSDNIILRVFALCLAPFIFAISFGFLAGLISQPFQKGIVPGKFPRNTNHPVYKVRAFYGLCWTMVYYAGPVYALLLALPPLRKTMFRLFGYKGQHNFIVYPDAWIRDLPLLNFGKDAYISNKCTIGSNICLLNGDIYVDKVSIGEGSILGHLAIVGTGSSVGNKTEIGIGTAVGLKVKIHNNVSISPTCAINHGVEIFDSVQIGAHSYIGVKVTIRENIKVPAGSTIPAGAIIATQQDMDEYISSENNSLNNLRSQMTDILTQMSSAPHRHEEGDDGQSTRIA